MARVGAAPEQGLDPPAVEASEGLEVVREPLGRGELLDAPVLPEAAARAEVGEV
ncbi:hypothetical protein D3C86_2111210 [compost metagenome]